MSDWLQYLWTYMQNALDAFTGAEAAAGEAAEVAAAIETVVEASETLASKLTAFLIPGDLPGYIGLFIGIFGFVSGFTQKHPQLDYIIKQLQVIESLEHKALTELEEVLDEEYWADSGMGTVLEQMSQLHSDWAHVIACNATKVDNYGNRVPVQSDYTTYAGVAKSFDPRVPCECFYEHPNNLTAHEECQREKQLIVATRMRDLTRGLPSIQWRIQAAILGFQSMGQKISILREQFIKVTSQAPGEPNSWKGQYYVGMQRKWLWWDYVWVRLYTMCGFAAAVLGDDWPEAATTMRTILIYKNATLDVLTDSLEWYNGPYALNPSETSAFKDNFNWLLREDYYNYEDGSGFSNKCWGLDSGTVARHHGDAEGEKVRVHLYDCPSVNNIVKYYTDTGIEQCYDHGHDYAGNNYGGEDHHTSATDFKDCQKQCQNFARCMFFTYNTENNYCFFKLSDIGDEVEDGLISGPKYCGMPGDDVTMFLFNLRVRDHYAKKYSLEMYHHSRDWMGDCSIRRFGWDSDFHCSWYCAGVTEPATVHPRACGYHAEPKDLKLKVQPLMHRNDPCYFGKWRNVRVSVGYPLAGADSSDPSRDSWRFNLLPEPLGSCEQTWKWTLSAQCMVHSKVYNDDKLDNPTFGYAGNGEPVTLSQCQAECSYSKDNHGRECIAIEWKSFDLSGKTKANCNLMWGCDYVGVWEHGSVFVMPAAYNKHRCSNVDPNDCPSKTLVDNADNIECTRSDCSLDQCCKKRECLDACSYGRCDHHSEICDNWADWTSASFSDEFHCKLGPANSTVCPPGINCWRFADKTYYTSTTCLEYAPLPDRTAHVEVEDTDSPDMVDLPVLEEEMTCIKIGKRRIGADIIGVSSQPDAESKGRKRCAAKCFNQKTPKCQFWNYDLLHETCELVASKEGSWESHPDFDSGKRGCKEHPNGYPYRSDFWSACGAPGTKAKGKKLGVIKEGSTPGKCAVVCNMLDGCAIWRYDVSSGTCVWITEGKSNVEKVKLGTVGEDGRRYLSGLKSCSYGRDNVWDEMTESFLA